VEYTVSKSECKNNGVSHDGEELSTELSSTYLAVSRNHQATPCTNIERSRSYEERINCLLSSCVSAKINGPLTFNTFIADCCLLSMITVYRLLYTSRCGCSKYNCLVLIAVGARNILIAFLNAFVGGVSVDRQLTVIIRPFGGYI
jgi:hypothetical protein